MIVAIIPARYESKRFPGKPLADICGKPMIQWVYERVSRSTLLDMVCVATDSKKIKIAVNGFGGRAIMTSPEHSCGSDRVAECANLLGLTDHDIILNIQGDEPMISPEMIDKLASCFQTPDVVMGTLARRINDPEEVFDSNVVKVVINNQGNALMFSRCPIPFNRDNREDVTYYQHIGIYGYRRSFLERYSDMAKGYLEQIESLEQLRVLENGYPIRVVVTPYKSIGVDTPDDLEQVRALMNANNQSL